MKKITSFLDENCRWCQEIREKYSLRQQIANMLQIEAFSDDLVCYATCPFHKATVYFSALDRNAEIIIEENRVVAHWWTYYYDYKLKFDLAERKCHWETNHEPSKYVPTARFDFNSLFRELLMQMNEEQLEKTLQQALKVHSEDAKKKAIEYIVSKFDNENYDVKDVEDTIEIDGKNYRVDKILTLECSDKEITQAVQGYFEHDNKKYFKKREKVYLLRSLD